jgi:hypothetical protein
VIREARFYVIDFISKVGGQYPIIDLRQTDHGYSYVVWNRSSHSIYMTGPDGKHANADHSLVPVKSAATNSMVSLGK